MNPSPEFLIIKCSSCSARNRVRLQDAPAKRQAVCARCKQPLQIITGPIEVTDESFNRVVEGSALPVLLDMWAPWCNPCRFLAPVIEQLAVELEGRVLVAKMNTDDNPQTANRFHIQSIPTLLVFKDGKVAERIYGAQPKSEIMRVLEKII